MKLSSLNPWLVIRWSLVALIYAGTVAIAVDQVQTKDRELVQARAKFEKTKSDTIKGLGQLAKSNESMVSDMKKARDAAEVLRTQMALQDASVKIANAGADFDRLRANKARMDVMNAEIKAAENLPLEQRLEAMSAALDKVKDLTSGQ